MSQTELLNKTECLVSCISSYVEMIKQGVNNYDKAINGVYEYELSNGDKAKCIWLRNEPVFEYYMKLKLPDIVKPDYTNDV